MKKIMYSLILNLVALSLVSCVSGGSGGNVASNTALPLGLSIQDSPNTRSAQLYSGIKLDVIVPVFDPNIPGNPDDYEEMGVWPELRRTESVRFANAMKTELQETMVFGDVRVAPDLEVAGDLYAIGKILKSNGEDIHISMMVYDSSGKRWMKKTFKHRVKEYHWSNIRQKNKDPYQPIFEKATKEIVKLLKKTSQERLVEIRTITEVKFASAFVPDAFSEHVKVKNKTIVLQSSPAENDPMLETTRALRVQDGLFMDKMQTHYKGLVRDTNDSYVSWQEHSFTAAKESRKAKSKATGQAMLGGLLLLGAAYAASEGEAGDPYTDLATSSLAVGGVMMLQNSFTASAEGKLHRETLMELGESLNFEVAPQVVKFEDTTVELRGGITSQFQQWHTFLASLYEKEKVPEIQL